MTAQYWQTRLRPFNAPFADCATPLRAQTVHTPLGEMLAIVGDSGLHCLSFRDDAHLSGALHAITLHTQRAIVWQQDAQFSLIQQSLNDYFSGNIRHFSIALAPIGTPFQQHAWRILCDTAYGATITYAQQAIAMQRPKAVRAVAGANARNPIAIMIPCHRVIGSNGRLTGYSGGLTRKAFLLDLESRGANGALIAANV